MIAGATPSLERRGGLRPGIVPQLFGVLGGLIWFAWTIGVARLRVTELGGTGDSDGAAHLLGWLFFRNDVWTLPLGAVPSLIYPMGTTLGFTDSTPLVALLLKPFSGILPTDFQYIGPWLALCFALQGLFGARIACCFTSRPLHAGLAALLFVLAPPMLFRIGHSTLTAHWLILALIWLHLDGALTRGRRLGWLFSVTFAAAAVHPYLAAMVVVLGLGLILQLAGRRELAAVPALGAAVLLVLQTLGVFVLLGYFDGAELTTGGFGTFSADLLTFVNGYEYSRWWPTLPLGTYQYEGFAFLGSGILLLAAAAPFLRGGGRDTDAAPAPSPLLARRWFALSITAALLAVFALSQFITAGGVTIVTMRGFYEPLASLTSSFRSSGRFVWPLHYVVVTAIVALAIRRPPPRRHAVTALLIAAVAMQSAEVVDARRPALTPLVPWPHVSAPSWSALASGYRHLAVYPPWYVVGAAECEPNARPYEDIVSLADFAYRHRLTMNSGYVARYDLAALSAHCRDLRRVVMRREPADDTIYVVDGATASTLASGDSRFTCAELAPYHVCISTTSAAGQRGPWRRMPVDTRALNPAGSAAP